MKKLIIIAAMIVGAVFCTACEEDPFLAIILGRWDYSNITAEVTCPSLGFEKEHLQSIPMRILQNAYRKANHVFYGEDIDFLTFTYCRHANQCGNMYAELGLSFRDYNDFYLRLNRVYELHHGDIIEHDCYVKFKQEIDGVTQYARFSELEEGYITFERADSTVYYNEGIILLSGSFELKFKDCEVCNGRFENIECRSIISH